MFIGYDYEIFEDAGISGKSIEKREKLQELLKRITEFDIVLCWSLSRLGRNARDNLNILHEIEKNKIRFMTYNEKIDTGNELGHMYSTILSAIAEMERKHISENVQRAMKQCFDNGNITARSVLGYDIINKKLVVNKKESKIVKFIFETYNKTRNYYKTAQICNNKGYKGKKGNEFHASSIKTIIQNQIYCGFNNFHDTETKKGDHQSIVSQSLYDKVNNIQKIA